MKFKEFKPVGVTFSKDGEYEVTEIETTKQEEPEKEETTEEKEEQVNEEPEQVEETEQVKQSSETQIEEPVVEEEEEPEEEPELEEQEEPVVEQPTQPQRELPEVVQKLWDFLEETDGTIQDFVNVNRDFDSMSQDEVIRMYMTKKYPHLDKDDIDLTIEDEFGYDFDTDDEREIRRQKLKKKKFYSEALSDLKKQGEKYKADLVSRSVTNPQVKEALEFTQRYKAEAAKQEEINKSLQKNRSELRRSFEKATKKVFSKDFKGFEVKFGDKATHYKPNDVKKVREQNMNVNNLLSRFVDEKGNVTDVKGYHKALTIASDPDSFAEYYYELGKVDAIEEEAKSSKNIVSTKTRLAQKQSEAKNKPKYKLVDPFGTTKKKKGFMTLKDY